MSSYFAFAQIRILNLPNRILVLPRGIIVWKVHLFLHRTTESERGLMVGGIYNYLAIKNKHMHLSFFSFSSEIRIGELPMAKSQYEVWKTN